MYQMLQAIDMVLFAFHIVPEGICDDDENATKDNIVFKAIVDNNVSDHNQVGDQNKRRGG